MPTMNPSREARLKLGSADLYPTLPVSRWTNALSLAELVSSCVRLKRPAASESDRALRDADFEFRGGSLHQWQAGRAHTRSGELLARKG